MHTPQHNQKSISELVQVLIDDVTRIARLEVQQIRVQIVEELETRRNLSVLMIAGVAFGVLAIGVLTLGVIDLLSAQTQWPRWLCDLTVAIFMFSVSAVILGGRKKWEQILKLSKPN